MKVLGISAFYHDAAAALVVDGEIVAAAQEERFTRKNHDPDFPVNAARFCLDKAGLGVADLDVVSFYDKPLLKFERLLQTYLAYAPLGFRSFALSMPLWFSQKLFLEDEIRKGLGGYTGPVFFSRHHVSHAASGFFPSPFEEAAVVCVDGVGEWATTSIAQGQGNRLTMLREINFPHSLGLLYSAVTYYTGFKVNSGEYKVMGLAPYGQPRYVQAILDNLIDLKEDGSFHLNMDYFTYPVGLTMTGRALEKLLGHPARKPESELTQREMDLAASVQVVIEMAMDRLAREAHRLTGSQNLCLAGGVALNCVANGKLLREGPFKKMWIQPAAGDAGGALGTALDVWHHHGNQPRVVKPGRLDAQKGSYLGPEITRDEVAALLKKHNAPARFFENEDDLLQVVAQALAAENVVGWACGPMEFGPRALGARSILGDPRSAKMQSTMNLKIKYRESFRPFAPSVLREKVNEWFEMDADSPYMLLVAPVCEEKRLPVPDGYENLWGIEQLNVPRSVIPAVTHVDYSARIQTVHEETNPRYARLLKAFEALTGCPVLVNTSFNVRGEPIVCNAEDAYRCFMRTEMDYLVLGDFLLDKKEQPALPKDESWKKEFALD